MIISTEKRNITKSGDFKTVNYGVSTENLALLFQMLRTNLYSDIPGSILRELVSNVVDSHMEAKRPDAFGEVQWIPENKLLGVDAQLIIRDYGVGISPERMTDTYANYLSSTKRDDNDAIGGFGLGSKVPFAYTDSFFVKTVYNGIETQYLCYIDDSQLGAISEMHCAKVDLSNRTEIIIPIKKADEAFKQFEASIPRQLSYFQKIKYIGFTQPSNNIRYEDQYCILLDNPPIDDAHIVLGNVPYAINFDRFSDKIVEKCKGANIGIKFKVGELQPTLSREGLFWSDKVVNLVEERIKKAQKSIRNQIEAELKAETDYGKWYASIMTSTTATFDDQWNFSNIKNQAKFNFNGTELEIVDQDTWFAGYSVRTVTRNFGQTSSGYQANPVSFTELINMPIFWLDSNLNTKTSLYLLKHHPRGFVVVHKLKQDVNALENPTALPYFEATRDWSSQLASYADVVVPDDEAKEDNSSYYKEQYRKLVQQRKLEGKFTAKELGVAYKSKLTGLDGEFDYSMYEGKFEEVKNHKIIYGFQDDHSKLCKLAGILTSNSESSSVFRNVDRTAGHGILFLKIGKHYAKQFAFMHNAHYVDNVLDLKTSINADLAKVASAYKLREHIHTFHILSFFQDINNDLYDKYTHLHYLVESNSADEKWTTKYDLDKFVVNLCYNNLDKEMETSFNEIVEYFTGVELLKTVNFTMNSYEHKSITDYLEKYVALNKDFIREFLTERGKYVDPIVDDFFTAVEPIVDDTQALIEAQIEEEIEQAEANFEQQEVV